MLAINPENRYIAIIKIITRARPIIPAKRVLSRESFPNEASTVLEDISVNLVGRAPELINSTNFVASSLLKDP